MSCEAKHLQVPTAAADFCAQNKPSTNHGQNNDLKVKTDCVFLRGYDRNHPVFEEPILGEKGVHLFDLRRDLFRGTQCITETSVVRRPVWKHDSYESLVILGV